MSELSIILAARKNNRPTEFELAGKTIQPCPFCGKADISVVEDDGFVWLCCTDCGVEGPTASSRIHAIQRWQRRAG